MRQIFAWRRKRQRKPCSANDNDRKFYCFAMGARCSLAKSAPARGKETVLARKLFSQAMREMRNDSGSGPSQSPLNGPVFICSRVERGTTSVRMRDTIPNCWRTLVTFCRGGLRFINAQPLRRAGKDANFPRKEKVVFHRCLGRCQQRRSRVY